MNPFTGKQKIFVEVKKKQDEIITLMFMRGPGKPVKDLSISARWLKLGTIGVSLTLVAGLAIGSFFIQDYKKLHYLKEENQRLAETNETQAVEIAELQGMTKAMQSKMTAIESLDSQVREKVGLEDNAAAENSENRKVAGLTVSRSGAAALDYDESNLTEELDTLEDLKNELMEMDILMTQQGESLLELKDEVDKQLAIEAATPNLWPMSGKLTSPFGMRDNPTGRGREMHTGIDIGNKTGTSIVAAGDGVVTFAGYKSGWGRMVLISHGYGYVSQYTHASTLLVKEGQKVTKGDLIAKCGTSGRVTGPHLHFGVQRNGAWIDPQEVLK